MSNWIFYGIAFIVGAGASWVAQGDIVNRLFTYYVPAMVTLLAAYLGVKYAFDAQTDKEKSESRKHNIASANAAIFNMSRMINQLMNFERQSIAPHRNHPARFINMLPTIHGLDKVVRLEPEDIYFLFDEDEPNLIGEIMVEVSKYNVALEVANTRSKMHLYEVQPILEQNGYVPNRFYTREQLEAYMGGRLFTTIINATDNMVEAVDSAIEGIRNIAARLSELMKNRHPNEKIITIQVPDQQDDALQENMNE